MVYLSRFFSVMSFYSATDGNMLIESDVAEINGVTVPVVLTSRSVESSTGTEGHFGRQSWYKFGRKKRSVYIVNPRDSFDRKLMPENGIVVLLCDEKMGCPLDDVIHRNHEVLMSIKKNYHAVVFNQELSDVIRTMLRRRLGFYLRFRSCRSISYIYLALYFLLTFTSITGIMIVHSLQKMKNSDPTEIEVEDHRLMYSDVKDADLTDCMICLDPFLMEDEISLLLCKHYFHRSCIDKWLLYYRKACPYCRFEGELV